jgi:AraC-like DNA-binding protein
MSMTVAIHPFSSFEALQHAVPDGRSEVMPLSRGRISGSITQIALGPDFGVTSGSFSRGVRFGGVMSQHRWVLSMLIATDGPASALGRELAVGDMIMTAPGEERYSIYRDATSYSAALVGQQELEAFLASQPGAAEALRSGVLRPADEATAANRIRILSSLTEALAERGPSMPDGTVEFYKRNILELVTAPIRDLVDYRGRQPRRSYTELVRDIDRYLIEAGNRPVHISELCDKFDVSRRALHRAFLNVLGIAPIAFARRKRLCDVHEALSNPERDATIKEIAIEHGFVDLGRFATAYRLLFGERPSQTLRRRGGRLPLIWLVCCNLYRWASTIEWLLFSHRS